MSGEPSLNPFELLGVTPQSTPAEVRHAYFNLCQMCHPDRGGHPEDMHVVREAYLWIETVHKNAAAAPFAPRPFDATAKITSLATTLAEAIPRDEFNEAFKKNAPVLEDSQKQWLYDITLQHVISQMQTPINIAGSVEVFLAHFRQQQWSTPAYVDGYGDQIAPFARRPITLYNEPMPHDCAATSTIYPVDMSCPPNSFETAILADYRNAMTDALPTDLAPIEAAVIESIEDMPPCHIAADIYAAQRALDDKCHLRSTRQGL